MFGLLVNIPSSNYLFSNTATVSREMQTNCSWSSTILVCQICVRPPMWRGDTVPTTYPRPTGRTWLALISRPTQTFPAGFTQSDAPTLPNVSANVTEAPPCNSPNGCTVRWSTGIRALIKSSPISINSIPRWGNHRPLRECRDCVHCRFCKPNAHIHFFQVVSKQSIA